MYTMKNVCDLLNISNATLRFYCDVGLIPNVKRDENNYRLFDEKNVEWIRGLMHLKKCGFSVKDMKYFLDLCLEGESTIINRKKMLSQYRLKLEDEIKLIQDSINYIDEKQGFYDDILSGKTVYYSNLVVED